MFELFGVNWLTHVQRSGVDNYLMAALDQVGHSARVCRCVSFYHTPVWRKGLQAPCFGSFILGA